MWYVHGKNDMHRDFSYANVMVNSKNIVKIIDFGFSKDPYEDTVYDTNANPVAQKFSPPEDNYDFRSEIYCIGAISFTILTGLRFNSANVDKLDTLTDINPIYVNAVKKCLDNDPRKRFLNAAWLGGYISNPNNPIKLDGFKMIEDKETFDMTTLRDIIQEHCIMEFDIGNFPTLNTIENWIEEGFKEFIGENSYFSDSHPKDLLSKILGYKRITFRKEVTSKLLFDEVVQTRREYLSIKDSERQYFLSALKKIIDDISKRYEMTEADLPF